MMRVEPPRFNGVSQDIDQVYDANTSLQGLQNLDLTSDIGLLDWLDDLDDYTLASGCVGTLLHL